MAARPKGDKYMADFMVSGTRHRMFGFSSMQEALVWEYTARAALALGKPLPPSPAQSPTNSTVSIIDLVALVHRRRWSAHKSGGKTLRNAERFTQWTGTNLPVSAALTSAKVGQYADHLLRSGCSGSTVNRLLAPVSVLGGWAVQLGHLSAPPLIPWQKEGEGRLRWFSDKEVDAILDECVRLGEPNYHALFSFLVDTGARLGEALKLDWECISCADYKSVTFWETKAGNHRTVALTKRARQALEGMRYNPTPFGHINPHTLRSFWERLRTRLPWLGEDAVIHTFRHTCASRLVQRNVDIVKVKNWMGHKAIQTTLRYAHLAPDGMRDVADMLEG